MKNKLLIILALGCLVAFASCKKAPLTIGKTVVETRVLPDFSEVQINDNINLALVHSDTCYIVITTGENIIDNITSEVRDNKLTISNTSTFDWIRPYDYELHATLYYKDITKLVFSSSGTLETTNQFNDPDNDTMYWLEVDGGSGDIDILVNECKNLHFLYQYGTSRVTMHGINNDNIHIDKHSYGIFDARDYQAKYVEVHNRSVGDCYIWATDAINAKIDHLGDIYYKGDPENIQITYGEFAKGNLLPLF